jgi:hypothetical protein
MSPLLKLHNFQGTLIVYESRKRGLLTRPIYECRCDERLKTKDEESTRLEYTGLIGELEHLKVETRLLDEKLVSVMGECVI